MIIDDPNELSGLFKLMSHPLRVRIIALLAEGPLSYTSLLTRLSEHSTGVLNFHLKKMQLLVEKDVDVYRLTDLGQKCSALMTGYEHVKPISLKKNNTVSWDRFISLPIALTPIVLIAVFFTKLVVEYLVMQLFPIYNNIGTILQILAAMLFEVIAFVFVFEKIWTTTNYKKYIPLMIHSLFIPWITSELIGTIIPLFDSILYISQQSQNGIVFQWNMDPLETLHTIYSLEETILRLLVSFIIALIIIYRKYGDIPYSDSTMESQSIQYIVTKPFLLSRFNVVLVSINVIISIIGLGILNYANQTFNYYAYYTTLYFICTTVLIISIFYFSEKQTNYFHIHKNERYTFTFVIILQVLVEMLMITYLPTGTFEIQMVQVQWIFPLILLKYLILYLTYVSYLNYKLDSTQFLNEKLIYSILAEILLINLLTISASYYNFLYLLAILAGITKVITTITQYISTNKFIIYSTGSFIIAFAAFGYYTFIQTTSEINFDYFTYGIAVLIILLSFFSLNPLGRFTKINFGVLIFILIVIVILHIFYINLLLFVAFLIHYYCQQFRTV